LNLMSRAGMWGWQPQWRTLSPVLEGGETKDEAMGARDRDKRWGERRTSACATVRDLVERRDYV